MRIKSYYKNSVATAIRQALEELGPDAMLIESRPAAPESAHRGRLEVVFGVLDRDGAKPAVKAAAPASGQEDLAAELQLLRTQIDGLRRMLQPAEPATPVTSEIDQILQELIASDIAPAVAESLIGAATLLWQGPLGVAQRFSSPKEPFRRVVEECIRRQLETAPTLGGNSGERPIVAAFVGPPGAGKTTAIAKIAVQHCLAQRRSVGVISVDADRVASHDRLRALAAIMGIGFSAANSLADLRDAVNQSRAKDCLLIDTPGFSASEADSARDLAKALDSIAGRQVHLVLPASMKRMDASACADFFEVFTPDRLLFTKFDETSSVGSVVSEALRLSKPLSFFSTGQGVPEDLTNACVETLLRRILPEETMAASAA